MTAAEIRVGETVRVGRPPVRGHEAEEATFLRRRPVRGRVVYAGARFATVALFARNTQTFLYNESFVPADLLPDGGGEEVRLDAGRV